MSKKRTNIPLMPIAIVLVAILVFAVIGAVSSAFEKKEEVEDVTAAGIAYLEAREKKDPGSVMQARQDIYQAKINAQRTQLINQLTNGTMDPFSLFKDYVLMGDSRAVGFWKRAGSWQTAAILSGT